MTEKLCYNGIVEKIFKGRCREKTVLLFTFLRRYDIITAQFEESKHPRDEDGKFTDKNNSFGGSDNGDKLLKAVNEYSAKEKDSLTSQEWALWYKAVAENKKLGYWAESTIDGKAILKVENNGAHKIVITGGTFEKPSVSAIYTFHDADEMNDAITELKELW